MNIEQIQADLSAMVTEMTAKGVKLPRAELCLRGNESPNATLWGDLAQRALRGEYLQIINGDTATDALVNAHAFIAALPDPETLVLRTYLGKLADAVDYGHENGIAAEYVDPVRITQKAMSDNLLTADVKAVA